MRSFECRTFGKWILAGEHTVIRGGPALVFPVSSMALELQFFENDRPLHVEWQGEKGDELKLLFWGVLENAMKKLGRDQSGLKGEMRLKSNLPVGAGLGASATLCGALARWCEWQGYLKSNEVYEFARSLEDLFHGESSGVDLAVALSGQGLRFVRGGERTPLTPAWKPQWCLSYSGQRGVTAECVNQVKRLFIDNKLLAEKLDAQMREAVQLAEISLNKENDIMGLKQAIDLAHDCFNQWGLIQGGLKSHMDELRSVGALAVKPTGSGLGGYVLSLWDGSMPESLRSHLIPV